VSRFSSSPRRNSERPTERPTNRTKVLAIDRHGSAPAGRSLSANRHQSAPVDTGNHRPRSSLNPLVRGSSLWRRTPL
jgi:hypothetical protein